MNPSRNYASSLALGGLLATLATAPAGTSRAGDYDEGAPIVHAPIVHAPIVQAASRCAAFGPGFVDMGNGICGRVGGHVRVQLGTHGINSDTWTMGGASSATLRSDGPEARPRVYSGVGGYNPFQ